MWRNPAALLALTVMILSLAGPARGSDYDSPESTGTPGNLSGYVDIQYCPQGRLLVGVGITTSTGMNLVDGITTACVAVSRTAASKPQWNGAPQGPTSSSTNGNLLCPTNSFVTQVVALVKDTSQLSGFTPRTVAGLRLSCSNPVTGGLAVVAMTPDGPFAVANLAPCNAGDVASGITGKTAHLGGYFKSVALRCSPQPAAVVVVPQSKTTTTKDALLLQSLKASGASQVVVPVPQETTTKDPYLKSLKVLAVHDFPAPMVSGAGVDVCLHWGSSCGAPAADEFCRRQGFTASVNNAVQNDAPPTLILGDNAVCKDPTCDRFSSISCH